jgi:hypothetical protein
VSYTKEEMARLDAEIARVAAFQTKCGINVSRAWNDRQQEHKAQWAAHRRRMERKRRKKEREAKKYWAKREAAAAKREAKRAAKSEHSYARERRSNINWLEVTGERTVASRQMHWERRATALAMRKAGLTFRAIGKRLDVSGSRARQMVDQAERAHGKRSPGEVWMGEMKISADMRRWQLKAALDALAVVPKHDPESDWIWMGLAA